MDNSSYLDCTLFDHIKNKIPLDDQHAIAHHSKSVVVWHSAEFGVNGQLGYGLVKVFKEGCGGTWIVFGDIGKDIIQILLGGLQVEDIIKAHVRNFFLNSLITFS